MRTHFFAIWSALRSSYWFIPSVMALGAIALAFGSVRLDEFVRGAVDAKLGWVYSGGPQGARAVLGAIAGSIITVAGTTFSITIAAFSLASSQFGPRLLRTFRRDTGNQVVLGTFIATFLYCLLVLRTVRGTDADTYVPHLSVTIGVLLACFSLAVLIYFIHHTAASIQVSHLIGSVGAELDATLLHNCPQTGAEKSQWLDCDAFAAAVDGALPPVRANRGGYLLYIDYDALAGIAEQKGCVFFLAIRPGDFIVRGMPIAIVCSGILKESDSEEIQSTMNIGSDRTPNQDVEFGVLQMVEIAVRALSPGINDPFTAVNCVDRISSALCLLEGRDLPRCSWRNASGEIRLVARTITYDQIVGAAFRHIRNAAKSNGWVLERLCDRIAFIHSRAENAKFREALQKEQALALRDQSLLRP